MIIATDAISLGTAAKRAAPLGRKAAEAIIPTPAEYRRAFPIIAASSEFCLSLNRWHKGARLERRDSPGFGRIFDVYALFGEGQGGEGDEDGGESELHDCNEWVGSSNRDM